jgi:transposase
MSNEEKYIAEKIKDYKKKKRNGMFKALVEAGYSCEDIAFVFDLNESTIRSWVYSDIKGDADKN